MRRIEDEEAQGEVNNAMRGSTVYMEGVNAAAKKVLTTATATMAIERAKEMAKTGEGASETLSME